MAASNFVLELDQRRERLLFDLIHHLGIPAGSVEHQAALDFSTSKITYHGMLDAEEGKVRVAITGFAEKLLLHGDSVRATRLLRLCSSLAGKSIVLDGHRMVGKSKRNLLISTPLENSFEVLELLLNLSGSSTWSADRRGHGEDTLSYQNRRVLVSADSSALSRREETAAEYEYVDATLERSADQSLPLSSTDDEQRGRDEGGARGEQERAFGDGPIGDSVDEGMQEWIMECEEASDDDDVDRKHGKRTAESASSDARNICTGQRSTYDGQERYLRSAESTISPLKSRTTSPILSQVPAPPIDVAWREVPRHQFGKPCTGTEMGMLGRQGEPVPFLRPCQTLQALQGVQLPGQLRYRSIPEAEVARAVLHMLRGLPGDIFVRVIHTGVEKSRDRAGLGIGGFTLSTSAANELAIPSLSPEALVSILDDFLRIGRMAEYARAFVEDAEVSALMAARPRSASRRVNGTISDPATCGEYSKHGNTSQAFVACVRRQLSTFEDAVAKREGWLYRRQRGLEEPHLEPRCRHAGNEVGQKHSDKRSREGASNETLLGIWELLREEATCLEFTMSLVKAGAGWWSETLPEKGKRMGTGSSRLRVRTGRLLDVLHEALVANGIVAHPSVRVPAEAFTTSDAAAPACRHRGWLLDLFSEVLAPYLRLMDAWITEGRVVDPHSELFFSRMGTSDTSSQVVRHTTLQTSSSDKIEGGGDDHDLGWRGSSVPQRRARHTTSTQHDTDPVVHIWDTGVVVHVEALPQFLAPLAPAIALAGQDISLMRSVRALVATTPDAHLRAATGRTPSSDRNLDGQSSQVGAEASTGGELLSLAETLSDSLHRLARRVLSRLRSAHPPGTSDETYPCEDLKNMRHPLSVIHQHVSPTNVARLVLDTFALTQDEDRGSPASTNRPNFIEVRAIDAPLREQQGAEGRRQHARWKEEENSSNTHVGKVDGARQREGGGGEDDSINNDVNSHPHEERGRHVCSSDGLERGDGLAASKPLTRESGDTPIEGSESPALSDQGRESTKSNSVHSDRQNITLEGSSPISPKTSEENPILQLLTEGEEDERTSAAEDRRPVDHDNDRDKAGYSSEAGGGSEEGQETIDYGFFTGTAQLALAPEATLTCTLHPALAPPSIPSLDGAWVLQGNGSLDGDPRRMVRDRCENSAEQDDDTDAIENGVAAAADAVAEVLPPAVILDTCLLSPLRKHCRLISSNCMRVFVEDLGLRIIAGVLRHIYLSPAGSKSDDPLTHFRSVLFGALTALSSGRSAGDISGEIVVRDVPSFLQDAPRLTSLLHASLASTGLEGGCSAGDGVFGDSQARSRDGGSGVANGECLRAPVVGHDRPLLEHFVVECRPERVSEWRNSGVQVPGGSAAFPMTADGRCVDLRVFSCLQLACRLPWPQSVALPPRCMDKYSRVLGLLLRLEFTVHVLEESHVMHIRAQREQPGSSAGFLDKRHFLLVRLFAFLHMARALRCYAVTQALVKPWSEFLTRIPSCGSLRGFIQLHEAYLDIILERCFLLPRYRHLLGYLLDALQAGVAFCERYGEYVAQLDRANISKTPFDALRAKPISGTRRAVGARDAEAEATEQEARDAAQECLVRLEELWETLTSSIRFVLPLFREMVSSRSGVHVNDLLLDLDFDHFFERQQIRRTQHHPLNTGAVGTRRQHDFGSGSTSFETS